MDVELGILILLNMTPPQKLVLAPGAIIRGNTVYGNNNGKRHLFHIFTRRHRSDEKKQHPRPCDITKSI